jgi:hypothetical protein
MAVEPYTSKEERGMFKRAMRVMLVGLVAMLGAKAQAHYIVVQGKCVWHSLECRWEAKDAEPPGEVNSEATTSSVEIKCPDGTVEKKDTQVTLVQQQPIVPADITKHGKLEVVSAFPLEPLLIPGFCKADPTWSPTKDDVLIHALLSVVIKISDSDGKLASTYTAEDCRLPDKFDFDKILLPDKFDFDKILQRGATYECREVTIKHNS